MNRLETLLLIIWRILGIGIAIVLGIVGVYLIREPDDPTETAWDGVFVLSLALWVILTLFIH